MTISLPPCYNKLTVSFKQEGGEILFTYDRKRFIDEEENVTLWLDKRANGCPEHKHDFFEFVYNLKGTCTHYIDGTEYNVKHGDMLFINRDQTHSYLPSPGNEFVNILINPEFIGKELMNTESLITLFSHSMFEEFEPVDTFFSQCVHFSGSERSEIDTVLEMLMREHREKNIGYKSVMHGGIRILFSRMLRALHSKETPSAESADELLNEIKSYIDENFDKKITLSEIAEKSFYNPIYFGNLLKKHFGKSFSTYIKEKRISKASELLKDTDKSIDEVMGLVGYSDKKLFYAHFKEMYGTTPGAGRGNKCF